MKSSQNFLAAALELIKKTRRSRTSIPEEWLSYSAENEDKSRARELAEEASLLEPSSSTPLNRKIIPLPSNASKEIILEDTSFSIQKILTSSGTSAEKVMGATGFDCPAIFWARSAQLFGS